MSCKDTGVVVFIMIVLGLILVSLFITAKQQDLGCIIDPITGLTTLKQPLVLSSQNYSLLYPPLENIIPNRNIIVPVNEGIIVDCVDGQLSANVSTQSNVLYALCNQHSQLEVDGAILDFASLLCSHLPGQHVGTLFKTTTPCTGGEIYEIMLAVNLTDIPFFPHIRICFDFETKNVLYVHHNITKYVGFKVIGFTSDLYYDDNNFYNFNVYDYYQTEKQRTTVNSLVGLPLNSTKYIKTSEDTLFDFVFRTTMLADTVSYVYEIPQMANLRYVNTIPMWKCIYNLNWFTMLVNIFDYVKNNNIDLEIYTGTYGITTLPHEDTGEDIELYLYVEDGKNLVPVPALVWKILYNSAEKAGIAFVTVNNPFQIKSEDIVCTDISDSLPWLTWNKNNVTGGFSYVCTYEDLKTKVSHLPELDVVSNLV